MPIGEKLTRLTIVVTYIVSTAIVEQLFSKVSSTFWKAVCHLVFPLSGSSPLIELQHQKFHSFLMTYMVFWFTKIIHCLGAGLLIGYQCWEFRTTTHVDYDLHKGLFVFETQWVYFIGLAFPTALLVDLMDTVILRIGVIAPEAYSPKFGNLILFPFLVLLSHDPKGCETSIIS